MGELELGKGGSWASGQKAGKSWAWNDHVSCRIFENQPGESWRLAFILFWGVSGLRAFDD